MIGLSGAHRTGKTTLAKAFATQMGLHFAPSSAADVHAQLGLDPAQDYPLETRLTIQREILRQFDLIWSAAPKTFITDRTPLDLIAYTMVDINKTNAIGLEDKIGEYVEECYAALNRHFAGVIIVPPALPYVVEPGKPPPSRFFQEAHHNHVVGSAHKEDVSCSVFVLNRQTVNLADRLCWVTTIYNQVCRTCANKPIYSATH